MTADPGETSRELLRLSDITLRFPGQEQPTLSQVDLRLGQGEFLAIVGPSGCGKSTLLRVLAGLLPATSGQRQVELPELDDSGMIAMVFQESRLLPWRSVWDNMRIPFELTGRVPDFSRIEELLTRTGLSREDFGKYPRMLSGGMKMRVAVARALVLNPLLVLLDEPFAAVDDLLREKLNEELLNLQSLYGFAAVLVTHHLGEAAWLSQRLLTMSRLPGRVEREFTSPWAGERGTCVRDSVEFTRFVKTVREALG
ncbi:MAG: ABC transporter ATP-binding protein [Planctomycetaceae bacterium]|nr:ABC transporter ATP-binding protein [Planctomycetaceae bacterium]